MKQGCLWELHTGTIQHTIFFLDSFGSSKLFQNVQAYFSVKNVCLAPILFLNRKTKLYKMEVDDVEMWNLTVKMGSVFHSFNKS